jgi:serine protease
MKSLLLVSLLVAAVPAFGYPSCGETVKIAVIDTGFNAAANDSKVRLCKFGHRDFSGANELQSSKYTVDPVPVDNNSHGTNIIGLIDMYARKTKVDYCIVVVKFWDKHGTATNAASLSDSIDYARKIGASVINISGGGIEYSHPEALSVRAFINDGGVLVAAAGNEGKDLKVQPFYPAMDDRRVIVVGNWQTKRMRAPTSNFGKRVNAWEVGTDATALDIRMTGTSQAAAIHSGKFISYYANKCAKIRK